MWYSPAHENSIWWHWMVIIVPRQISADLAGKAYLQIEAGKNGDPPDISENSDIKMAKILAISGGFPTSIIFQVPNQRLYFPDDWWYEGGSGIEKNYKGLSQIFYPTFLVKKNKL